MSKFWRWIAPIAVAGGLIASGAVPAADASPAATSITINATSPHYPGLTARDHGLVDGYAIVVYKHASSGTATISGTVTTTPAAHDVATLRAEPFGATKYTTVQGPVALSPSGGYSFSVTPTVATHYKVQLSGTDTNLAGPVTVYVTSNGSAPPKYAREKCSRTQCTFSLRLYTLIPASAYRTESRKHVYLYLAIGDPRLPRNYTLSTSSKASRATRVSTGVAGAARYWETLTWYVPVRNARTRFLPNACTKDTEKTDGLGLPGRHGCGDKHFSRSAIYVG